MPDVTRKTLSTVSYWLGTIGATGTFASGTWVFGWSNDAHGAVLGLLICVIGLAITLASVLVILICRQVQAVITTNAIGVLLGDIDTVPQQTLRLVRRR